MQALPFLCRWFAARCVLVLHFVSTRHDLSHDRSWCCAVFSNVAILVCSITSLVCQHVVRQCGWMVAKNGPSSGGLYFESGLARNRFLDAHAEQQQSIAISISTTQLTSAAAPSRENESLLLQLRRLTFFSATSRIVPSISSENQENRRAYGAFVDNVSHCETTPLQQPLQQRKLHN